MVILTIVTITIAFLILSATGISNKNNSEIISNSKSSIVPKTSLKAAHQLFISSMSCTSVNFCIALDSEGRMFKYIKGKWVYTVQLKDGVNMLLNSISCPDEQLCVAVGTSIQNVSKFNGYYANYSNGSWSNLINYRRSPAGLNAISCSNQQFCVIATSDGQVLYYRDGKMTSQILQLTATPQNSEYHSLMSVSCPTENFCGAVGNNGEAYTYLNRTWSQGVKLTADSMYDSALATINCLKDGFCIAASHSGNVYLYRNGVWSAGVKLVSNKHQMIEAVSCASDEFCIATDNSGNVYQLSNNSWSTANKISTYPIFALNCSSLIHCIAISANGLVLNYSSDKWSKGINLDLLA